MAAKGYHSYRGKMRTSRKLLVGLLCLLLVVALAFLYLQRYVIYRSDGTVEIELPWAKEKERDKSPPIDDLEIIVEPPQELDEPETEQMRALELDTDVLYGATARAFADLEKNDANALAIRIKEEGSGKLLYTSAIEGAARAGAVGGNTVSDGVLQDLLTSPYHTIARISALHDSTFAFHFPLESAIIQIQHPFVVWYDPDSTFWLAPEKEMTRSYLADIAAECAQMGFDELLFDSFSYPPVGRLSNIDESERMMTRSEALNLLAKQIKEAVADTPVVLSVELDAQTVLMGSNETRGQMLTELVEYFDKIYVPAAPEEVAALRAAVQDCELVPIVSAPMEGSSYLLVK